MRNGNRAKRENEYVHEDNDNSKLRDTIVDVITVAILPYLIFEDHKKFPQFPQPPMPKMSALLQKQDELVRDVDYHRVWELMIDPAAPWLHDPAICVDLERPDNAMVPVDDTHRIIARWLLHMPDFLFYRVPLPMAARPSKGMAFIRELEWGD
jgi:hypothetical protein